MNDTLENWKVQKALCFIALTSIQDKILTKKEQKILARYYLLGENLGIIANRYKMLPREFFNEKERAKRKLLKVRLVIHKKLRLTNSGIVIY